MLAINLLVSLALTSLADAGHSEAQARDVSPNYLFSFGDSYSQTAFNPKGTLPNESNPIGNPNFPGGTSTGRTNWIGYLTAHFNKSLIYTYNYAYGGAVINETLVTPFMPGLVHFPAQVDRFLEGAGKKPEETQWTSENALFSVAMGFNDILNSWNQTGDRNAFSDVLLDNYFQLVEKMYGVGGRNFLFVTVPPIERTPLIIEEGPQVQKGQEVVIKGFNSRLVGRVDGFKETHEGVQTWIYDAYSHFSEILDNPTKYGFRDATSWSWGTDSPDIFWGDSHHPSTYADKYVGERVAETLRDTIW